MLIDFNKNLSEGCDKTNRFRVGIQLEADWIRHKRYGEMVGRFFKDRQGSVSSIDWRFQSFEQGVTFVNGIFSRGIWKKRELIGTSQPIEPSLFDIAVNREIE